MVSKHTSVVVSVLFALTGCGAQATSSTASTLPSMGSDSATLSQPSPELFAANPTNDSIVEIPVLDLATLPAAPWTSAPLAARDAPRSILTAWRQAENREWCAPMAPGSMGAASGARGRASRVAGGWVVEFDRSGLPGVDRQGNECDTCGRSVFGIAGTSMAPEELLGDGETPPTFSDGSHAIIEVSDGDGESVASATFTVAGQGCVYEVWSFLGPEHLEELVSSLRFVESGSSGAAIALAD